MTRSPGRQLPARYRLRVGGHLDHHWSPWFGDLTLTHDDDGTTSLTGVVADQAELHGLLTKIRDLGVTLISVETVDPRRGVDATPGCTTRATSTTEDDPADDDLEPLDVDGAQDETPDKRS
jgi:hypothetical protein